MNWIAFANCIIALECILLVAWLCRRCVRTLRKLPAPLLVALALLAVGTDLDAQKTNIMMRAIRMLLPTSPENVTVTDADIERGWQTVSVVTNENLSLDMPTNAEFVGNWHVHGASSSLGNNRIDFEDFSFPLGTNGAAYSSFWYFVDARIRPTPHDSAREISAVGAPMFALPGRSRLWTAEGADGSRVVTWEDFFLGSSTNSQVNAQITLYPNGDFTTCSNGVVTVCSRVNPDDWDGDGIPNAMDDNPQTSDGDFFGAGNALPDGANTNAYCSVRLVATGPDTLVTFAGDGVSDYQDPCFVAKSGMTNEVMILIGKTYAVSSDWPIVFVGASDPATEIWRMRSSRQVWHVTRPVDISVGDGNPFTISVSPMNLGGTFSWQQSSCGCSIVSSGNAFSFDCSPSCTCCGSSVDGSYVYEGYSIPVTSCLCGCYYDGTGPEWDEAPAPLSASVSASFSKSAVIFEDGYNNTVSHFVPRRSGRVRLNIVAVGGPNGSTLNVGTTNLAKLLHVSGPGLPLANVSVPAESQVTYSIVYEGQDESQSEGDIVVTATVTDVETGEVATNECSLTSVRLELSAVYEAPENPCTNRHVYGVGEKVRFAVYPQLPSITLSTVKFDVQDSGGAYELFEGVQTNDASVARTYTCPISANYVPPIKVSLADSEYPVEITLVEPQEVITRGAEWGFNAVDIFYEGNRRCWPSGSVGTATLVTTNYIGPMTVSFRGIAVSELPCDEEDTITGCLTNVRWRTHTFEAGAGRAHPISEGNFWFVDSAYLTPEIGNWEPGGELVLKIPVGWHRRGVSDDEFYVLHPHYESHLDSASRPLVFATEYKQRFVIDSSGTCTTEKYGHRISRSRYCRVILDGITLQGSHPLW